MCVHKFDRILLTQVAPCSTYTSTGTCGAFLTAANRDPAIFGAACNSSVLTITADLSIHGLGIQCQNPITGAAIGNASLSLVTTIGDLIDGTNYTVSVAAINCAGSSNSSSVSVQTCVPTPVLQVGQSNVSGNTATIPCTFLDGSSHYCMVCCSPSLPVGLAGPGYLSSINGPSVSVSLQGLTRGQMYYCKAAATNTNSNNCAGPVVGGVKMFITMTTYNMFSICKSVT
ncbi:hypothetical protein EMCRGX_G012365 [Ephydatia muelleri]